MAAASSSPTTCHGGSGDGVVCRRGENQQERSGLGLWGDGADVLLVATGIINREADCNKTALNREIRTGTLQMGRDVNFDQVIIQWPPFGLCLSTSTRLQGLQLLFSSPCKSSLCIFVAYIPPLFNLPTCRYSSICAIENKSNREEDEQWLAYWILYSFLTLFEMVAEPILYWIPFWHTVKMVFVAWLVLPQLRGASFVYEELVKGKLKKYFRNLGSDRLHEQKAED
ncbi:hypothetical protein ZIOFF_012368 [Zingiber officinale]|uniref:HVA22-like protein n=1 Tax=Zingiber officinale TaxID=94328 RepID=A0A8J5LLF8_ZINOF|nr:hypothetical protein ZIOFF_012368 [Zingiber officinale]